MKRASPNNRQSLAPTDPFAAFKRRKDQPMNGHVPVFGADGGQPIASLLSIPARANGYDSGSSFCSGGDASWMSTVETEPNVTDNDDNAEISQSIVDELNALSVQERETLQEEVHGVLPFECGIQENSQSLQILLQNMQRSIDAMDSKPAYTHVRFVNPGAAQNLELRLMMLRSEKYDALAAARRLVRFFEFQQELFGPVSTGPNAPWISQDDLTPSMTQVLEEGSFQVSQHKDRSGRTIVFMQKQTQLDDWKAFIGMNWYVYQQAVRSDITAQTRGLVAVVHDIGQTHLTSGYLTLLQKSSQFVEAFPFRLSSYHYCYQNAMLRPVLRHLRNHLSKAVRLRVCTHYGTFMECVYRLMSYGIILEMLPADFSGKLLVKQWNDRLDQWRSKERQSLQSIQSDTSIIVPNPNDVVLGRGRPFQEFPGNKHLMTIIDLNRKFYAETPRAQKTAVALAIMSHIQKTRGGRFLRRNKESNDWEVAPELEGRNKISHGFRAPEKREEIPLNGQPLKTIVDGVPITVLAD